MPPVTILIRSLVAAALLVAATPGAEAAEPRRPSVIFILTDDQGWGDAAFAGHPYAQTPSLDRLAREGTWCRQFYAAATVCSPSRCGFLTGQEPARHKIHGHFATPQQNAKRYMPNWLDPAVTTLPRLLQKAGYTTGHVGKWHLGSGSAAPRPTDYGFDFVRGLTCRDPHWTEPLETFSPVSTTAFVDEAIRFIDEHRARPFYLQLWTLMPHAPLNPTAAQLAAYANLLPRADEPAFGEWMRAYAAAAPDLASQMRIYCAALTDLDTQIGRLLAALDRHGLADDTLVFLSSDNGPEDYHVVNAKNAGLGNTASLRGRKRSMYEGGVRTFGLMRWPKRVPAGRVDDTSVVSGLDWLPTICSLVGVPLPAGLVLDGENMADVWLGTAGQRSRPLHWEWLFPLFGDAAYAPPQVAIRDGRWKFFCAADGGDVELYDVVADAAERVNVTHEHADLVEELRTKAMAWQRSLPPSRARKATAIEREQ